MILMGIISFILTLLICLIIPVRYSISGQKKEWSYGEIKVKWFEGCIAVVYRYDSQAGFSSNIRLLGINIGFLRHKDKIAEHKRKNFDTKCFLDITFLKKAIRLFHEVINHIKPQTFIMNGKIGLNNPFDTAVLMAFFSLLNMPDVKIKPIFDKEIFECMVEIKGQMVIGMILILFIKFLIAKPVRNMVIKLIKNKGEKSYAQ